MPGEDFYLRAFNDLSTTRQIGMAAGPIPWDKIVQYADRVGLEPDVSMSFVRIVRRMDDTYLEEWVVPEMKAKTAK